MTSESPQLTDFKPFIGLSCRPGPLPNVPRRGLSRL